MVIVYKTGWITYQIAKRLVDLESIGLVNLVLGTPTVPELIQHEAQPSTMAARLERYISDVDYCTTMTSTLRNIPSMLGGTGASERAASLIGEFL
jgi:lipid-A-disaccharide synthase